jgi:hypothetical protein
MNAEAHNVLTAAFAHSLQHDARPMSTAGEAEHFTNVALSALTAGHAVVKLPGRCEIPISWGGDCLGAWQGPALKDPVSAWPSRTGGEPEIALPDGSFVSLQDALDFAGALLAALKAVESVR